MSFINTVASTKDVNLTFSNSLKALRLKQVQAQTGLCRSAIYAKAKVGEFPAPIKLGNGRSSAWLEHEVDQWLQQQIEASRKTGGAL